MYSIQVNYFCKFCNLGFIQAIRAELVLPVFLHEPFLRGNKKYILSDVTAVKNWSGRHILNLWFTLKQSIFE